jgi:hypothetical protein
MALTLLGDIVTYVSPLALGNPPRAAIIIEMHDDSTVDLRVFNGFVAGTTDVENVSESVIPTPGSFYSQRGSKGAGVLHMPLNDSTDDIVALDDANPFVGVDDNLLIDSEYMTVTDASDLSNIKVTRKTGGSAIAAHEVGALVKIGVELPAVAGTSGKRAHSHK